MKAKYSFHTMSKVTDNKIWSKHLGQKFLKKNVVFLKIALTLGYNNWWRRRISSWLWLVSPCWGWCGVGNTRWRWNARWRWVNIPHSHWSHRGHGSHGSHGSHWGQGSHWSPWSHGRHWVAPRGRSTILQRGWTRVCWWVTRWRHTILFHFSTSLP